MISSRAVFESPAIFLNVSDNVLIAEKKVVNCPIKSSSFAVLKSGGTDFGNFQTPESYQQLFFVMLYH